MDRGGERGDESEKETEREREREREREIKTDRQQKFPVISMHCFCHRDISTHRGENKIDDTCMLKLHTLHSQLIKTSIFQGIFAFINFEFRLR